MSHCRGWVYPNPQNRCPIERVRGRYFVPGGKAPEDLEEHRLPEGDTVNVPALIREVFGLSGAEARRMLAQGAVKIDGETITDQETGRSLLEGGVLKVGKRRFARLVD